jgi:hypothetical protein
MSGLDGLFGFLEQMALFAQIGIGQGMGGVAHSQYQEGCHDSVPDCHPVPHTGPAIFKPVSSFFI